MFDDNLGELDQFFEGRELTDGEYILSEEDYNTYLEGMGPQTEILKDNGESAFTPQYLGIPVKKA